MEKKVVFISHITEEQELAFLLKDYIEKAFLGAVDVFVSSHGDSIPPGSRWLDKISEALGSCVVCLVLCSPASVKRPWIQFETGAGWSRGIPVIPLCHSGSSPVSNPVPLSELQGVMIDREDGIRGMMESIAKSIGLNTPTPDCSDLISSIMSFEKKYTVGASIVRFLDEVGGSRRALKEFEALGSGYDSAQLGLGRIPSEKFSRLKSLLTPELSEFFSFTARNPALTFYQDGSRNDIEVVLSVSHLRRVVDLLRSSLDD